MVFHSSFESSEDGYAGREGMEEGKVGSFPFPSNLDPFLNQRGVRIEVPDLNAGDNYWRIRSGRWLNREISAGKHHIYVYTVDEYGNRLYDVPFKVSDSTEEYEIVADKRPPDASSGNFPMSPSLKEYSIWVNDGRKTEKVTGIGMGDHVSRNPGIHTSTELEWELVTFSGNNLPNLDPNPLPIEDTRISQIEYMFIIERLSIYLQIHTWNQSDVVSVRRTIQLLKESGKFI